MSRPLLPAHTAIQTSFLYSSVMQHAAMSHRHDRQFATTEKRAVGATNGEAAAAPSSIYSALSRTGLPLRTMFSDCETDGAGTVDSTVLIEAEDRER